MSMRPRGCVQTGSSFALLNVFGFVFAVSAGILSLKFFSWGYSVPLWLLSVLIMTLSLESKTVGGRKWFCILCIGVIIPSACIGIALVVKLIIKWRDFFAMREVEGADVSTGLLQRHLLGQSFVAALAGLTAIGYTIICVVASQSPALFGEEGNMFDDQRRRHNPFLAHGSNPTVSFSSFHAPKPTGNGPGNFDHVAYLTEACEKKREKNETAASKPPLRKLDSISGKDPPPSRVVELTETTIEGLLEEGEATREPPTRKISGTLTSSTSTSRIVAVRQSSENSDRTQDASPP